jgi:hypothetical protein
MPNYVKVGGRAVPIAIGTRPPENKVRKNILIKCRSDTVTDYVELRKKKKNKSLRLSSLPRYGGIFARKKIKNHFLSCEG